MVEEKLEDHERKMEILVLREEAIKMKREEINAMELNL